jgi:hypothetical protein
MVQHKNSRSAWMYCDLDPTATEAQRQFSALLRFSR